VSAQAPGAGPVRVVIVHRDEPEKCCRTIEAFMGQDVAVEVCVVDNDSQPTSLEAIRLAHPEVEVIPAGRNAGFGPAANIALRRWLDEGAGQWVVVAPHDALPRPDCLARILEAGSARRAGLASAEYGPGHEYKPALDRYLGGYVEPAEPKAGWEDAPFPHGTLLVARREALAEIGLFDERYFAYCEEADLGIRARQAGWGVGIIWGAVVANPGMSEGSLAHYLKLRNTLLLVRDHFGRYPAFVRLVIALASVAARSVSRRGRLGPWQLGAELRAVADYALRRFGPPPPCLVRRLAPAQTSGQG
jgi:N-acetylglucosaminyl-diphospho-decaprenol L-rhamnosyltransferase